MNDLHRNPTVSLLSADEFHSSYLLGRNIRFLRTDGCKGGENSASSTASELVSGTGSVMLQVLLTWMDDTSSRLAMAEEQQTSPPPSANDELMSCSSNGVSNGSHLSNTCSSCSHSIYPSPSICMDLSDLREAIVALLLLEVDAIKWYKERSVPYFVELAKRIDDAPFSAVVSEISSSTAAASCPCRKCWCVIGNNMTSSKDDTHAALSRIVACLIVTLKAETAALQNVLLSFPTNAGGVPQAFLELDPHGKWTQVLELDLEKDGLEIISC